MLAIIYKYIGNKQRPLDIFVVKRPNQIMRGGEGVSHYCDFTHFKNLLNFITVHSQNVLTISFNSILSEVSGSILQRQ